MSIQGVFNLGRFIQQLLVYITYVLGWKKTANNLVKGMLWNSWINFFCQFCFQGGHRQNCQDLKHGAVYGTGYSSQCVKSNMLMTDSSISWGWCVYFPNIGPIFISSFQNFHNHSVLIHLWRIKQIHIIFCKYLSNESSNCYEIWNLSS